MRMADRLLLDLNVGHPHSSFVRQTIGKPILDVKSSVVEKLFQRSGLKYEDLATMDTEDVRNLIEIEGITADMIDDEQRSLEKELKRNLAEFTTAMKKYVALVPIMKVDNVYQYVQALEEINVWEIPSYAPPFENFFMEWRQTNGRDVGLLARYREEGPYVPGEPLSNEDFDVRVQQVYKDAAGDVHMDIDNEFRASDDGLWYSKSLPTRESWQQVHGIWTIEFFLSPEGPHGPVFGPAGKVILAIDENYKLVDLTWGQINHDTKLDALLDFMLASVAIFAHACSILNCANVTTVWYDPPAALQKKHRKKRGSEHPLVRYHVIQVEKPTGARARSHKGTGNGELVAMHPVRGHYKHFGDCCPGEHPPHGKAFGKIEGKFFIADTMAGNPQRGTNMPDYEVKP